MERKNEITVQVEDLGTVYFEELRKAPPLSGYAANRTHSQRFRFESEGREYWGEIIRSFDRDGRQGERVTYDVELMTRNARTGFGRYLPETAKRDWRLALQRAFRSNLDSFLAAEEAARKLETADRRFEVSAAWMSSCGLGKAAKVFPVIRTYQRGAFLFADLDNGTPAGWTVNCDWRGKFIASPIDPEAPADVRDAELVPSEDLRAEAARAGSRFANVTMPVGGILFEQEHSAAADLASCKARKAATWALVDGVWKLWDSKGLSPDPRPGFLVYVRDGTEGLCEGGVFADVRDAIREADKAEKEAAAHESNREGFYSWTDDPADIEAPDANVISSLSPEALEILYTARPDLRPGAEPDPVEPEQVSILTEPGRFTVIGNRWNIDVYPEDRFLGPKSKHYISGHNPGLREGNRDVFESRLSLADAIRDAVSLASRDGRWPADCYAD